MEQKYKKMSKKQLESLEITQSPRGFTIWAKETTGKKRRHWILDASCLLEDGEIRILNDIPGDKLVAKFNEKSNTIELLSKIK